MLQNHFRSQNLNETDVSFFKTNGYLIKSQYLDADKLAPLKENAGTYLSEFSKSKTISDSDFLYEDTSSTLRLVRNVHEKNSFFRELALGDDLISLAIQLTGHKPELLNTKLNFKNAFTGEQFDWHQDSIYLGCKNKNSIAFIIAVDEVTHENGPMMIIPRSHEDGIIDVPHRDRMCEKDQEQYPTARTKNLPLSLPNSVIKNSYDKNGITSFVGKAGSLFAMHCSIFHASNLNLSPSSRASFLIRYKCG